MPDRTARIHLQNLTHNLDRIRKTVGNSRICLSVKANGYGHGALIIARTAVEWGVHALGIATVQEAIQLRQGGITGPLILYGHGALDELDELPSHDVEAFAGSGPYVMALGKAGGRCKKPITVHLKLDTGMGRLGIPPDDALGIARLIEEHPYLTLGGLCTHFPVSESREPGHMELTRAQLAVLGNVAGVLRSQGIDPGLLHAANSGAIALYPESHLDMVRPGLMAYGYPPRPDLGEALGLKPVMELESSLTMVKSVEQGTRVSYGLRWAADKPTYIGTIALGYADGLPRTASGKLWFMINGVPRPQVGTICMDQCMVDLGPREPPEPGSGVTIFGPQSGAMTAESVAEAAGTIPYETLCAVAPRVRRIPV